jgi:hypothetical protein
MVRKFTSFSRQLSETTRTTRGGGAGNRKENIGDGVPVDNFPNVVDGFR